MKRYEEYTFEEVKEAIDASSSIKEFIIAIGLPANNGNYRAARYIASLHDLELPIVDYSISARSAAAKSRMSNDEWFVTGVQRGGQASRKRLVLLGVPDRCSISGCPIQNPEWNGSTLVLQLDHINGDHLDNRIDNLRIVCPNCHTQTSTFSNRRGALPAKICKCGEEISRRSEKCISCYRDGRIRSRPRPGRREERKRRAKDIRQDFSTGATVSELSERYGVERTSVYDVLKNKSYHDPNWEVPEFKKSYDSSVVDEIMRLYLSGMKCRAISETMSIPRGTVWDIVRRSR